MQVGGAVDSLSEPLTWAMLAALKGKHGVGKSTVDKLRELWTTGYCGRVQGIRGNDRSMALIELQKLRGIGEKAAEKLWDRGIKSRADVQREAASLELPDSTRAHLRYAWAEKVPRVAVEEIAALCQGGGTRGVRRAAERRADGEPPPRPRLLLRRRPALRVGEPASRAPSTTMC